MYIERGGDGMADEQLLILKMLEDGKINAAQATELLTLVGPRFSDPAVIDSKLVDHLGEERHLNRLVREEERRARRQVKHDTRQEQASVGLRPNPPINSLEWTVQKSLQRLGIPLGGNTGLAAAKELSGEFCTDHPEVSVQNTNGRINIQPSHDNHWHLTLDIRGRAMNAEMAKELIDNLITVSQSDSSLEVHSRRLFGQNAAADISLSLPPAIKQRLSISCTNGTINLTGLTSHQMVLRTVNGKIAADGFSTKELEAHSVNGGISLSGTSARIRCRAANGRVDVRVKGNASAELELETVNGPILVSLPQHDSLGYQVEAESMVGGIDIGLQNMTREERSRPAHRQVRAKSQDLKAKESRQSVKAKTVSGGIRIYGEGEV